MSGETKDRGVILPLMNAYETSAVSSAKTRASANNAQGPVRETLPFPSLRMIAGCRGGRLASFTVFSVRGRMRRASHPPSMKRSIRARLRTHRDGFAGREDQSGTALEHDLVALGRCHRPTARGTTEQAADQRPLVAPSYCFAHQGARGGTARDRTQVPGTGGAGDDGLGSTVYAVAVAVRGDRGERQVQHGPVALLGGLDRRHRAGRRAPCGNERSVAYHDVLLDRSTPRRAHGSRLRGERGAQGHVDLGPRGKRQPATRRARRGAGRGRTTWSRRLALVGFLRSEVTGLGFLRIRREQAVGASHPRLLLLGASTDEKPRDHDEAQRPLLVAHH